MPDVLAADGDDICDPVVDAPQPEPHYEDEPKASGGPVPPGAYLVGEQGPETFRPKGPGTIHAG